MVNLLSIEPYLKESLLLLLNSPPLHFVELLITISFLKFLFSQNNIKIDKFVSKLNTIIVIPYRTSYVGVKDQFESITERRMRDIDMMYTYFAAWTKCKVMRLNVDDENLEREVNEILNFMEDIDEGSV